MLYLSRQVSNSSLKNYKYRVYCYLTTLHTKRDVEKEALILKLFELFLLTRIQNTSKVILVIEIERVGVKFWKNTLTIVSCMVIFYEAKLGGISSMMLL